MKNKDNIIIVYVEHSGSITFGGLANSTVWKKMGNNVMQTIQLHLFDQITLYGCKSSLSSKSTVKVGDAEPNPHFRFTRLDCMPFTLLSEP